MASVDIPVHVIGGYLGAGKTTFLNHVLATTTVPIAVIINDFGSINIDRHLLKSTSDNVIELTNGCICCAVGDSIADAIYAVLDHRERPAMLLIEASGVADPGAVSAFSFLDGLRNAGTIVLVDAERAVNTWKNPLLTKTFERQIRSADVISLTKTELATTQQLVAVRELIHHIAPMCPMVALETNVLSEIVLLDHQLTTPIVHNDMYSSYVVENRHWESRQALQNFISELPITCIRAKGIVALGNGEKYEIHRVGTHVSLRLTHQEPTGIVVIELQDSTNT